MTRFKHFAMIVFAGLASAVSVWTQQWEILGNMAQARRSPQIVQLNDEEVLVAGGGAPPIATCEIINVRTRTIRQTASMLQPRASFAVVKTPTGKILAIGGWSGGSYDLQSSVEQYDPQLQQWTIVGSLQTPRFQHSAVMLDDHRILVVGGRNERALGLSSCEIYDTRSGRSVNAAEFPFVTTQHQALKLRDGRVAVLGGRSGGPGSFRSDVVYVYNVANDAWDEYARMIEPTFYPAATVDGDGSIIIAGGSISEFAPGTFKSTDRVQVMNGQQTTIINDRLSEPKVPQAVIRITDGRKLVVGGWLGAALGTRSCDWINADNTTVTAAPSLQVGRGEAACMPVQSTVAGSRTIILSVGGVDSTGTVSSVVEIFTDGCDAQGQSVMPPELHYTVDSVRSTPSSIQLTAAEQFSRGAVWAKEKVDLRQPFTMLVGFRMANGSDNGDIEDVPSDPGADGIALVVQNQGLDAIGQYGRGIGYDGIKRSLAVEFDTYHNTPVNDPNGNHVGVQSMGRSENVAKHLPPANLAFSSNILPMKADGTVYYAYIEYANKRLSVYLNDRPSFRSPIIVRDIDLDSLIGLDSNGRAWVGITSATGRSMEQHEIVRWEINACPEFSPVSVRDGHPESRSVNAPFIIHEDRLLRDDADICVVDVVDVRGSVLWTTTTTARNVDLPVSLLASGRYLVCVRSLDGMAALPWVVLR